QDRGAARDGAAVHEPDLVLAGDRVVPEDVGLAVAAEVADAGDGPVLSGDRRDIRGTLDRAADDDPDRVLTGALVAPQDVGRAADVKVIHGVHRHDRRRWWWWWRRSARDDEVDGRSTRHARAGGRALADHVAGGHRSARLLRDRTGGEARAGDGARGRR